jgi:hypothetical protein
MNECTSNARQFTIRETFFGTPVLYVRSASLGAGYTFEWGKWRKARPSEIQMAIIKLSELQQS